MVLQKSFNVNFFFFFSVFTLFLLENFMRYIHSFAVFGCKFCPVDTLKGPFFDIPTSFLTLQKKLPNDDEKHGFVNFEFYYLFMSISGLPWQQCKRHNQY